MKVICAYCGKDMGQKNGKGVAGESHSVCQECLNKLREKLKKCINIEKTQPNSTATAKQNKKENQNKET